MSNIYKALQNRILILDGAMGTMLQQYSLSEEDRLEVGITAGLVRVSVGLEHINDIIADIEQALVIN